MNLPLLTEKFNCTERNGRIEFEFTTQENDASKRIRPKDHEIFREFSFVKGRDVYIYGKGPNESYAALAFYLVLFQARKIECYEYNHLKRDVLIHDAEVPNAQISVPGKQWFEFAKQFPRDTINISRNQQDPEGYWEDDIYLHLERMGLPAGSGDSPAILVKGKGGPVMYAALACAAARLGYNELLVDKPKEENLLAFNERVAGRELPKDNTGVPPGFCLGILGDPCSGKSVFAQTLFNCICDLYPPRQIWVYDCDMAAPTQNWFMRESSSGDPLRVEAAIKRRKELKVREFTSQLELDVAQSLKNEKSSLQLVIADLPGGNHKVTPPQRIPVSRAEMMRQCDAFIVLCRKDKPNVFDDWVGALKEYGLENRVIAKVTTDAPKGPVAVSELAKTTDGLLTCEIQGLDREKGSQLIDVLKPTLEELGRELQRHFGQSYDVL
ncbi:MAG: hypothetical protein IKO65_05185 [Victivallales bacterium]|nr:hypothetical protein [Victivallales bacterium]